MKLGSLFSGIGGLDLGVEHATGARTVWQVEADPWCRSVLAQHWPDARRYVDVRTAGTTGQELEHVDIIAGGFPCQDVSVAGKRAGLTAGERSGLWREFARIIREVRPRYVFVENVAGLLSMEFGHVLADLAALGFDAEWTVLRASDVGAPHRRERVFILAVGDAAGTRREGCAGSNGAGSRWVSGVSSGADEDMAHAERGSAQRHGGPVDVDGTCGAVEGAAQERERRGDAPRGGCEALDVAHADGERLQGLLAAGAASRATGRGDGERAGGEGLAQPGVGRGADGLPRGLDAHRWPAARGEAQHEWEPPRVTQAALQRRSRLKALGNAVVPQQAALAWRVLSSRFGGM